jgi:hypothetical protein
MKHQAIDFLQVQTMFLRHQAILQDLCDFSLASIINISTANTRPARYITILKSCLLPSFILLNVIADVQLIFLASHPSLEPFVTCLLATSRVDIHWDRKLHFLIWMG